MSSRDAILAAIRANKPGPRLLPDVPFFDEGRDDDLLGRFSTAFEAMGGTVLEPAEGDSLQAVRERVEEAGIVVSMVPEIAGNRVIAPLSSRGAKGEPGIHEHPGAEWTASLQSADEEVMDSGLSLRSPPPATPPRFAQRGPWPASPRNDSREEPTPASLADVDIAIVRAAFGIAETGSIALTERELGINTLAYLAQHLIVLLDPADIVVNLHHAYQRPEFTSARYTVFHTGPSATADIEGVLIHGAQGVRSLSILPLTR